MHPQATIQPGESTPVERRKGGRPKGCTTSEQKKGGRSKGSTTAKGRKGETPKGSGERKKGGRPKGTTIAAKREKKQALADATEKAAAEYLRARAESRRKGERCLRNGTLEEVCQAAEKEMGIPEESINRDTVRSRVTRGNPSGRSASSTSPLQDVEPLIVEACVERVKNGETLTCSSVIPLALSIIKGTEYERKLLEWKKIYLGFQDTSSDELCLSAKWYSNFMKRHKEDLKPARNKKP